MKSLRQELQSSKCLNPFSDAFDTEELQRAIQKAINDGQSPDDISVGMVVSCFHQRYDELRQRAQALIVRQDLTMAEWEAALLTHCNLTYLRGRQQGLAKLNQQNGPIASNSFQTLEISTVAGHFRLADTLDTHVDALQLLLGYLPHLAAAPRAAAPARVAALAPLAALFTVATQAATYKATYEELLWRPRRAQFEFRQVRLVAMDKLTEETLEIGKSSIYETYAAALTKWRAIQHQPSELAQLQATLRHRRQPCHPHAVVAQSGYVQVSTRPGIPAAHLADAYARHMVMTTYYSFVRELRPPTAADLTIEDVCTLYGVVSELAGTHIDQQLAASSAASAAPYDPIFRIKEAELLQLLQATTDYVPAQLTAFVGLLTHQDGKRINFWHRPFVRREDDLLFTLLPLSSSHLLYLVDKWLLAGDYQLKGRGKLFEQYLRQQLPATAQARGFFCRDLSGKLQAPGQWKAIDMLLEFKHCLLLVEAKCLGYPLEAHDKHNAYQDVCKGAEQAQQNAAFLETHRLHLARRRPGLATKPLVHVVVTNLPLFSGLVVAGVPITDAASLLHYFKEEGCWRGLSEVDAQGHLHRTRSKWMDYYTDELGFCQYLPQYLAQPVFTTTMRPFCRWYVAQPGANLLTEYVTLEYGINPASNEDKAD